MVANMADINDANTKMFVDTINHIDVRSLALRLLLSDVLAKTVVRKADGTEDWDKYIDRAADAINKHDAAKAETQAPPAGAEEVGPSSVRVFTGS